MEGRIAPEVKQDLERPALAGRGLCGQMKSRGQCLGLRVAVGRGKNNQGDPFPSQLASVLVVFGCVSRSQCSGWSCMVPALIVAVAHDRRRDAARACNLIFMLCGHRDVPPAVLQLSSPAPAGSCFSLVFSPSHYALYMYAHSFSSYYTFTSIFSNS